MRDNTFYKRLSYVKKGLFAFVIILFLLVQVYPVIWVFMASLKPTVELSSTPFSLPSSPTLENFMKVIKEGKIWGYLFFLYIRHNDSCSDNIDSTLHLL